jgi:hypothetical protein
MRQLVAERDARIKMLQDQLEIAEQDREESLQRAMQNSGQENSELRRQLLESENKLRKVEERLQNVQQRLKVCEIADVFVPVCMFMYS